MKNVFLFVTLTITVLIITCTKEEETPEDEKPVEIIQWQKCFGGSGDDFAYSIQQTTDGGYVATGYTTSYDGDVSGNQGWDWWVIKLNAIGNLQWQKCFGEAAYDEAYSIQQTEDKGYIVAGRRGEFGFCVLKLNAIGNLQWQKCFGVQWPDEARCIRQTNDGGYIAAGSTGGPNEGNLINYHGSSDFWIIKLNANGDTQWQKCFGGSGIEKAMSIQQTTDGGYIAAGYSQSTNGDVTGNHGDFDYWIIKLDALGNLQWQKCLGGSNDDEAHCIQQTSDGGYVVAGYTYSNDGDVSGNHGWTDYWIVKLNALGIIQWQRCFGGSAMGFLSPSDDALYIQQTNDGGYIVGGVTLSADGDVTGFHGGNGDYWIIKLNKSGNLQWQKCLGGSEGEAAYSIQQTTDGGYVVAGYTYSDDGDVSGNHGDRDFWIVKLKP